MNWRPLLVTAKFPKNEKVLVTVLMVRFKKKKGESFLLEIWMNGAQTKCQKKVLKTKNKQKVANPRS